MTRLAPLAAAGFLCAALASAQPAIRLRNRNVAVPGAASRPRLTAGRHQIVQFESYPDSVIVDQLVQRGVRVLGYVPDNALMVSALSADALRGLPVRFVGSLEPADKMAPGLAGSMTNRYLAIFHGDVGADRARELARASGFDVVDNPALAPGHLLLTGSFRRLAELAVRDELAYVMEASVNLVAGVPVMSCPGALSAIGAVGEYAQAGQGWSKDSSGVVALKYVFQTITTKVDGNTVRGEIERAFREWAKYANVSFSQGNAADAERTIAILFASGLHGDVYPFDGPGKSLAHTYYPAPLNPEPLAGDMHLDADEEWGVGAGTDVFSVALHEAGHALGLAHSTDPASVMYPYYRLVTGLTSDDIAGIQGLYGSPESSTAPPVPPVPPVPTEPAPPTTPTPPTEPAPPVPPVPTEPPTPTSPTTPPVPPVPTEPTTPTAPPTPPAPTDPTTPSTPNPPAAPPKDTTAPSIRIVTPGSTILSTSAASITVAGTASDETGVASVKWSTGTGDSGTAAGAASWSATIRLYTGTNIITVRAYDAAGNSGWRSLTVVKH